MKISKKSKLKLTVRTYRIPANRDFEEGYDPLTEFTDDLIVNEELIEVDNAFKINELGKEVQKFNERQQKVLETIKDRNYVNIKRIVKTKANE